MAEEILPEENKRLIGRDAQRNNILAARVVAETVKTTLGPKGMDKMLVDRVGNVTVTNDGVTILKEMDIEHPAAKMVVDIAKTQDKEVGDGTTSSVMIAGKLLEQAETLLDKKIHPTIITKGYRLAEEKAQEILRELAVEIDSEESLQKVAATAMTGKGAEHLREYFSNIIVEAIKIVAKEKELDKEDIKIEKQQGRTLEETELIKGVVLGKGPSYEGMPKRITEANIAIIEEALEIRNPETEARISVSSPDQLQSFLNQEDRLLQTKVTQIKESGANTVFCQRGIDEFISFQLAKEGIYAINRLPKEDIQRISKATGAKVVAKLKDLTKEDLGYAQHLHTEKTDETNMTYITGCKHPGAVTIIIRGGTNHVIEEIHRAFADAIGVVSTVVKESKVVAGGGAVEIELAKRIKAYATKISGRERLAIEEYAKAIECIPTTLAENAGLDPLDILTELRASHDVNNTHYGLNLFKGKIEDTIQAGIIEPLKVKTQAIAAATEVAIMILRIDDIIAAKRNNGGKNLSYESMRGLD